MASAGDAFGVVYWIGAIACSMYFWFSYSRGSQGHFTRRLMTMAVFMGWPLFLAYLFFQGRAANSGTSGTSEAKKRILE